MKPVCGHYLPREGITLYKHPEDEWAAYHTLHHLRLDHVLSESSAEACPEEQCDHWFHDGPVSGEGDQYLLQLEDVSRQHVLKEVQVRRSHIGGRWELGLRVNGQPLPFEKLASFAFEAGCEVIAPQLSVDRQVTRDTLLATLPQLQNLPCFVEAPDEQHLIAFLRLIYKTRRCSGCYNGQPLPQAIADRATHDTTPFGDDRIQGSALAHMTRYSARLLILAKQHVRDNKTLTEVDDFAAVLVNFNKDARLHARTCIGLVEGRGRPSCMACRQYHDNVARKMVKSANAAPDASSTQPAAAVGRKLCKKLREDLEISVDSGVRPEGLLEITGDQVDFLKAAKAVTKHFIERDFGAAAGGSEAAKELMMALYEEDFTVMAAGRNKSGDLRGMRHFVNPLVFRYAVTRLVSIGRKQYLQEKRNRRALPSLSKLQAYIAIVRCGAGVQHDVLELMQKEAVQRSFVAGQRGVVLLVDEMILKVDVQ